MIYLDNATTSWPKPETVYRAVERFIRDCGASPGRSGYRAAVEADALLIQTRAMIKDFLGAPAGASVVFTLNCTDALNIALKGLLKPGDHVVTSHLEHNSVSRPLNRLEQSGVFYSRVLYSEGGMIDTEAVRALIGPKTRLIVLAHGSNVLGTVQPAAEIGRLAREYGVLFLLDAAQTAGEVPIDMQQMNVDLLACSGHKGLLGPAGTGLLIFKGELDIQPLREGGTGSASEEAVQPKSYPERLEAGTPNMPGIAGLKAGLEFIQQEGLPKIAAHKRKLTIALQKGLSELKAVRVFGSAYPSRRTGLVTFNIQGWNPSDAAAVLEARYSLACRAGLHCAPWAHQALSTFPEGAVRFSPGYFNTEEEIAKALEAVFEMSKKAGVF
jgi:cysteine desulfurase family protein